MNGQPVYILGIESSCDDTAAAVLADGKMLANVVAGQEVHRNWGGVVPELASRAHQQHIVPVVDEALRQAKIGKRDLHAIAYTRGPGLLGSLLVGGSFAKGLSLGLNIPLIEVNHMQAHILAHFIEGDHPAPQFPFLCLTVSGGHTQIVRVDSPLRMHVLGETRDDAAGEAFDKVAKILGLPYPGGPMVDALAQTGNPNRFVFPEPKADGFDFSFSGLKTSFLYLVRDEVKKDPGFAEKNIQDLCASVQHTIVNILLKKLLQAAHATGIRTLALAGGVSANKGLRDAMKGLENQGYRVHIPPFAFCTDNAAMIAMTGYFKYQEGIFSSAEEGSMARYPLG
jgi:N6-L-threonylcarbamoyladenine synthase